MPKPDVVATSDVNAATDSTNRTDKAIPTGWRRVSIREVVDTYGGGTPSTSVIEYWNGDIRWATPTDVTALSSRFISETAARITELGLRRTRLRLLPAGTLLVTSRATIGARALAAAPMATNQGFAALVCKTDAITPEFLYYLIGLLQPELKRLSSGSTFTELSRGSLRAVCFLLPPLTEQQKIAAILSSVDDVIEWTNALVEQTRLVKQALAQELLTHGIPGRHSRYKQTELGEIPEQWEVVRLGDIVAEIRYGTSAKCRPEPIGLPVLRIPNVARGEIETGDLKYAELGDGEVGHLLLQRGDLLVIRTNGNPDVCGRLAIFRDLPGSWLFASYLLRVRVERGQALPDFVEVFLNSKSGREQLRGSIRTSAGNYNLSARGLANIRVARPPMEEQREIVAVTRAIDDRAAGEERWLKLLYGTKASLMDALLKGRLRVSVPIIHSRVGEAKDGR